MKLFFLLKLESIEKRLREDVDALACWQELVFNFLTDYLMGVFSLYLQPQISMSPDHSPPALYRAVYQHWFFKKEVENKVIWQPFSMSDSLALESQFLSRKFLEIAWS